MAALPAALRSGNDVRVGMQLMDSYLSSVGLSSADQLSSFSSTIESDQLQSE